MTQGLTMGWPEGRESHKLWISVKRWDYKLFFESPQYRYTTVFQWEGIVTQPHDLFRGVKVLADIEFPPDCLNREDDEDDARVPKSVGSLGLVNEGLLGLSLFVSPTGYHDLLRLFAAVFSTGERGAIGIEVVLRCDKSGKPGFWQSGWQSERLDVLQFHVHTGSSLKDRRTLLQRVGGSD